MKNGLKALIILCIALVCTTALQAQRGGRGGSPEERAERQTTYMVEQLSLSEAQATKVKEVNLKYGKKMMEARQNAEEDRSALRETMYKINKENRLRFRSHYGT